MSDLDPTLFTKLFEEATEGMLISDKKGRILEANPAAVKLFGYEDHEELLNAFISDLVPKQVREDHRELVEQHFDEEKASERKFGMGRDLQAVRKDGTIFPVEISLIRATLLNGQKVAIRTVIDISERVRYQKLTEMMISEALEKERERISKELHDSLAQLLAGISMKLQNLPPNGAPETVQRLQEMTEEAIQETRALSYDLMPPNLYEKGPFHAIRRILERVEWNHGIRTELQVPEKKERYSSSIETTLFRICQEGISNAVKHANAPTIRIIVQKKEIEGLYLTIQDDGAGFEAEELGYREADPEGGMGMQNMRQRVQALNRDLSIHSEPRKGTLIKAFLPF